MNLIGKLRGQQPQNQANVWTVANMPEPGSAFDPKNVELGIVSHCAMAWGNLLASSACSLESLRPHLFDVGQSLITRGWWGGGITNGSVRPASGFTAGDLVWEIDFVTPDRTYTTKVPRERFIFLPWATLPGKSWVARSPAVTALKTFQTLHAADSHAKQSLSSRLRWLIKSQRGLTQDQRDQKRDLFEELQEKNYALLVGDEEAEFTRIVTDMAENWPQIYRELEKSVAVSCLVPPSLVGLASGDPRAAARRFAASVQAVGHRLAVEVSRVFKEEVTIQVPSDQWQDKARALGTLVKAGLTVQEAREIVGL